ncbi:OsmC family protein [Bacillus testis]|uniref:OsmC family protein n=1 Tax=Bacillus testis TaxID=1622072 RepID=UPI00067EA77B|nr:OsmC family protein [Bacillus testis]
MADEKWVEMSTKGQVVSGMKNEIYVRDFSPIIIDEPVRLGGSDEGPNPLEYLLGALSACTSITIAMVAKQKGFSYSGLSFSNSGKLDARGLSGVEGVTTYFQTVSFEAVFETEERDENLQALKEEVEKRCPIYNLLKDAGVAVDSQWKIKA